MRAGEIQLATVGKNIRVDKKGTIDLVTEIDIEIERGFRAMIAERFPDHAVLGEEFGSGESGNRIPHFCWVFDPIDGTTNYAHGLPIFCVSVALERAAEGVILGVVHDPMREETFVAERGRGAMLNGRPVSVSDTDEPIRALIATDFPYDRERMPETLELFGRFSALSRGMRRSGAAALDLCYVVAGRLDGYYMRGVRPWDLAAGSLIVREAGGKLTDYRGGELALDGGEIVASNGRLHSAMTMLTGKDGLRTS